MKPDLNIDELLNGYIDGELTPRQEVEVKRLINHDPKVASRLHELQQCKTLVNSLPLTEAPPNLLEDIKLSLERKPLYEQQQTLPFPEREGVRHLFFRKLVTAAAMVGLVAVLAGVIYSILAPSAATRKTIAGREWRQPLEKEQQGTELTPEKSIAKADTADLRFDGRIQLKTDNLVAVDAFINRIIVNNGLLQNTQLNGLKDRSVYAVNCSHQELELLLTEMKNIWQRFNEPTLFVETELFNKPISVKKVAPRQIIQLANQQTLKNRTKMAKDFAVLNNINELLPGSAVLSAIQDVQQSIITIPKPVLTSPETSPPKQPPLQNTGPKNVYLTIVIEETL
ncbi:anti-sigma factor family protein [Planctomycetota bacterium]